MGGRKQSVQLMDRNSLADVSPVQVVEAFEGGVWLVWQYRCEALCVVVMVIGMLMTCACRGGVRMRVNYVRGTNQVISAVLFDVVPL